MPSNLLLEGDIEKKILEVLAAVAYGHQYGKCNAILVA
jgi:hypothetical protein